MEDLDESENTNVIYITEEHRVEWTNEATRELLKLYDEKCDLLETGIITTQKRLWELVSKDMAKKNLFYTGPQCENKWKTLKRCFRNKIERLSTHGSNKRPCPFQDEIAEILNKRPFESMMRSYSVKRNIKKDENDESSFQISTPGFSGDNEDMKNTKLIRTVDDDNDRQVLDSTEYFVQDVNQIQVIDELADLTKVIGKHNKLNTELLRNSGELHEKLVQYFEGAAERDCQKLELEETRMEQQNEMIKQMKIQNSLLQKLLDKLG